MSEVSATPQNRAERLRAHIGKLTVWGARLRRRASLRFDPSVSEFTPFDAGDPVPVPSQLTSRGSRRDVTLPAGWSRENIRELLASLTIDEAPASELAAYLDEDFERFLITWHLVRNEGGAALEIGANPYFTTMLLWCLTSLDLTLTNCFDPTIRGTCEQGLQYVDPRTMTLQTRTASYESLDVESQSFPWPDESFEVILFCEVLEHLTVDPMAALLEIHRVLKPGGTLVVSTPNVARLENVGRLVAGANMYDPYSGYGAFGRHNREYTRHELVHLLQFCGFAVEQHFTADVHPHRTADFVDPAVLAPLLSGRLDDLGQYLFARGTKMSDPQQGRPSELYRSMGGVPLVSWDGAPGG
jgi:SAM-dependent methyltransferase